MYYIVYALLYLLSLLPLQVLYLFSELAYFVIYHLIGYRKAIVVSNIKIAFPEKTEKERIKIAKGFYRNFTDTFIETIKLISASDRFVDRHCSGDFEVVDAMIEKGKSLNLMAAHQFNWEFVNLLYGRDLKVPFVGVYMPISNKIFDRIYLKIRSRYNTVLVSAFEFKSRMHKVFSSQYGIGLAADQNPGNPSNAYWLNFFGKPAPFVTGPAKGAVRNNVAVIMVGMTKPKRGYYHFTAKLITEEAARFTPQQLTVLYRDELENIIRQNPSNYLWSHRRWKYEWKPEYGEVLG